MEAQTPPLSIGKSVAPDYLICLEDGKPFKTLRRHLALLGLTPQQYREKWRLPQDYPMVARNCAARRSALANKARLREKADRRGSLGSGGDLERDQERQA